MKETLVCTDLCENQSCRRQFSHFVGYLYLLCNVSHSGLKLLPFVLLIHIQGVQAPLVSKFLNETGRSRQHGAARRTSDM